MQSLNQSRLNAARGGKHVTLPVNPASGGACGNRLWSGSLGQKLQRVRPAPFVKYRS